MNAPPDDPAFDETARGPVSGEATEAARAASTSSVPADGTAAFRPTAQQTPAELEKKRSDELERARDRALVEQSLRGDLEAFNRLVELYQDSLFGLTFRVVNDRDAAADAVQEAFFSAYRNLGRFRGDSFKSWLIRIAINAATDILRQRKRRPLDPFPEWEDDSWQPPSDENESPERTAIHRSRSRVIAEALAQITTDQRTAIVLFDIEGYDYQEIADMTGVSLGTVKSRIHRGRLALRDLLSGDMELLRD